MSNVRPFYKNIQDYESELDGKLINEIVEKMANTINMYFGEKFIVKKKTVN